MFSSNSPPPTRTGSATDWWTDTYVAGNNLWRYRTDKSGQGGGDMFESNGSVYEDAPLLKTTITGLTADASYDIRLIYHAKVPWATQGGLSADSLTVYDAYNGTATGTTYEGGTVTEYQVLLGATTANSSGEEALAAAGMGCCDCATFWPNNQATARSMHIGGVFCAMADGSVHWIGDYIEVSTDYNNPSVWDRLNLSRDGGVVDISAF